VTLKTACHTGLPCFTEPRASKGPHGGAGVKHVDPCRRACQARMRLRVTGLWTYQPVRDTGLGPYCARPGREQNAVLSECRPERMQGAGVTVLPGMLEGVHSHPARKRTKESPLTRSGSEMFNDACDHRPGPD